MTVCRAQGSARTIGYDSTLAVLLLATTALTSPLFIAAAHAQNVPTGGSVAAGSVAIVQPSATQLNITQSSQSAVVNWQSFSVSQGSTVNIAQPNSSSAILNRVTSNATSNIAGQINANGQVYLVNPNGIAITKSGVVNTGGGFVASTLGISDADFQSGKRTFTGTGSSAAVSNAGAINVGRGGYAALIGGTVSNSGSINVPLGKVGLGSGERATLDFSGDGFLQVAVPTSAGGKGALIKNSGSIKADGGSVTISAATAREAARNAINISGVVQARSIGGRSGAIVIGGGGGGHVKISGRLDASSRRHSGGTIQVTGQSIKLKSATVDASGKTGGGMINIGGGRQGNGPLQHANTTTLDANTVIKADAIATGNGGNVVVWSDQLTTFTGTISAKGGAISGNGGEAEVSGKATLAYTGFANLSAAHGAFGTLLLDPFNVTISSGAQTTGAGFTANGNDSVVNVTTLQNALAGANVTVSTGSSGSQAGNITVSDPVSWTSGNTLTLNAAGNIAINGAISGQGGNYGGFLTLQVGAGKSITQTQSIYAGLVTVIGSGAQVTLTNTGNSFFNVAGNLGTGVNSSVSIYNQSGYYIWSNAATSTYGLTADTVRLATDFGTIGQQNSQPGDPANKITTGSGGLILAGTTNSTFNLNNEANVISKLSAVGRDITVFTSSPTLTVGNFGGINGITSGGTNTFGRLSLQADKYVFLAPVSAATSIQLASNTHNLAMEIGGATATPGFTGVTILASDLAQFSTPALIFGRNDSSSVTDPNTFITTYTPFGPTSITLKGPIATSSLAGGGPQAGQTFNSLSLYAAGNVSQDSGAIINLGAPNPNNGGQNQLAVRSAAAPPATSNSISKTRLALFPLMASATSPSPTPST